MPHYNKKFIDRIFSINVTTDDINLLRLIDRQLDLSGISAGGSPRFNISFHIVRKDLLRLKNHGNFIILPWKSQKTKMVSSFGVRVAEVEVDLRSMSVKVEFCGDWEPYKEPFLDFIFFQPIRVILECHRYFFVHGAALERDDACVFILGDQGSGKSTLSLTLAHGGFKFLCDDDFFIGIKSGRLSVLPLRTKIGVRENALKKWPHLSPRIIPNYMYGGKQRLSLKDFYSDQMDKPYAKKVILFPKYDKRRKMSFVPLSQKEILPRIGMQYLNFNSKARESEGEKFLALYALIRNARAFELVYSDKELNQVCPKVINQLK